MKFFRRLKRGFKKFKNELEGNTSAQVPPPPKKRVVTYEELLTNKEYGGPLYLGVYYDTIRGEIHVPLNFIDRFRHMAVFGGTGLGKSTLLINMVIQDIYAGHGLCFIDPKGDAIEEILMRIPEHRLDDVIVIDPANHDKVVGMNFLEVPKKGLNEAQLNAIKEVLVSDLVALMKQQTQIWGERFGRIFETLIRAMLDFNEKASPEDQLTFLDLYVLLTDEEVRNKFAESVKDPIIREYLLKINEMQDDVMEPVIRRLNDWVMNKVARQIVAHRKSSFDFREAIDSGKIILVRIPKGEVGETIMQLVGLTVISKIWAAAKSRVDTPPEERKPFFLYVDEFSNFAFEGSTFDEILSEARAFRLGLILATQYPSQLSGEIREAVYGNCGTIISFNPQNPNDARVLIKRFPGVKEEDLLSLGLYTVMLRLTIRNEMSDPFIIKTYPPTRPLRSRDQILDVIQHSLSLYGRERMTETDLSASLRKIKEMSRYSVKTGAADDMIAILYSLVVRKLAKNRGYVLTYEDFVEEAKKRMISVSEQQYADLLQTFENMGLVEIKSELGKSGKSVVYPKLKEIRAAYWDGKFNTILAGLIDHRKLVERVFEFFTQLGFIVDVPPVRNTYTPDLVLKLPVAGAVDLEGADLYELLQELMRTKAWELVSGRSGVVEIETTTQTRPGQLLTKLKRAYKSKKVAIFVVRGSGLTVNDYTAEARYILQVLMNMSGRKGLYRTDEIERDHKGRKLWENKHSGAVAYEEKGVLYDSKTSEPICMVCEAKKKGWVVKKVAFDPVKEFGNELPQPRKDYRVLIFPPDDFEFPVVEVVPTGTGFKLIPVRKEDAEPWVRKLGSDATAHGMELTEALKYALKAYAKGEKVKEEETSSSEEDEGDIESILDEMQKYVEEMQEVSKNVQK